MNDPRRLASTFAMLPSDDAKFVSMAVVAFPENKTKIRLLIEACKLLELAKEGLPLNGLKHPTVDQLLEECRKTVWQALMNGEYP